MNTKSKTKPNNIDSNNTCPKKTSLGPHKRISVLHWYATHYIRYVSMPLYKAGLKLQNHWELISKSEISTVNYANTLSSTCKHQATNSAVNNIAAAWHEFQQAMRFVGGPGLHSILLEVVCKNMPISQFEKKQKWRRGCGSIVLHIALYRLALFYKQTHK